MATNSKKVAWSGELPIEIVTDILARLPAKSLLRFRCVCKSWLNLIASPEFIDFHRNQYNNNNNNNNGHILVHYINCVGESIISLHCEHTFVEKTRLEQHPSWKSNVTVLGCSNGLVCLCYGDYKLALWNPSIRKFKVIPGKMKGSVFIAFGFVSRVNDYRLFAISPNVNGACMYEIYSLRTNSWKRIEDDGVLHRYQLRTSDCEFVNVVDGVFHILAMEKEDADCSKCILWFDMADEVFGKIEIAKFFDTYKADTWYTMQLGEFLVVLCVTYYRATRRQTKVRVDIWARKKNSAGAESWTKHTIDHEVIPLGFLKNDEFVLQSHNALVESKQKLDAYDPRLSKINSFQLNGVPGILQYFTYYTESLTLLNEGN